MHGEIDGSSGRSNPDAFRHPTERCIPMSQHPRSNDADGFAALGICESLLLALTDLKIISEEEARDLLTDVATSHTEAALTSRSPEKHQAVVKIVQHILAGKNGVRH